MTIKQLAAMMGLAAWVVVSSVTAASASPFIFGSANGAGHEIFKFDLGTNNFDPTFNGTGHYSTGTQSPDSLVITASGDIIYSMETAGEIHRLNPTTLVDQVLVSGLHTPKDMVLEPGGTSVLVSQAGAGTTGTDAGHVITRVTLCAVPPCTATNLGTGPATPAVFATLDGPHGLAYVGANLYAVIGDRFGGGLDSRIAQLDPTTGAILASAPSGFSALFPQGYGLDGLTYDPLTGRLFSTSQTVSDPGSFSHVVFGFNPASLGTGPVSSPVSVGGAINGDKYFFEGGSLYQPDGLVSDGAGNIYIAEFANGDILNGSLTKCVLSTEQCTVLKLIHGADDLANYFETNRQTGEVPEPATMVLLGSGLLVAVARARRRAAR